MKKPLYLFIFALLIASCSGDEKVDIWMIGDSTMAWKSPERAPETGWGMELAFFVNDKAELHNHAVNGRSSKSFVDQGRWKTVLDSLRKGDYVIIQFGHNDAKPDPERHTDPFTTYKEYLAKFVTETREKGGNPIICSSIVRRHFDENGKLINTHGDYIVAAREAAAETNTPYVDMEALTRELVTSLGPEGSKSLYLFCEPGECPKRSGGVADSTHLNHQGASEVAALFVKEVRAQNLSMEKFLQL